METVNLQLLKYSVNEISFVLNENYALSDQHPISLKPVFTRTVKKIDQDNCEVSLRFIIQDSKECPAPFTMTAVVTGAFKLKDWEKKDNNDLINMNAVAIMFPFLRALIATITSNANIPAVVLPVFNVIAYFENEEKKEQID